MIDSHAHLNDERLADIRQEVLSSLGDGLDAIVEIGTDTTTSADAVLLANSNERVFATVGTHPEYAAEFTPRDLDVYRRLARNKKVVALGEIGLDYHYRPYDQKAQGTCFLQQLGLAHELNLPLVLHLRDAYGDMRRLLEENSSLITSKILLHCYGGDAEFARYLSGKFDAYFAFGGALTFKKTDRIEPLKAVPRDRLLFETDCPYITPEPFRGKLNRPEYVKYTLERAAALLGMDTAELDKISTANTKRFYGFSL